MDWKLSEKAKKTIKDTFEAPIQVTAYIGALNHDPNYKWAVSSMVIEVIGLQSEGRGVQCHN